MSDTSAIEWCDATHDPIGGCTHASEGCDNCWAEGLIGNRLAAPRQHPTTKRRYLPLVKQDENEERRLPARWSGRMAIWPDRLLEMASWRIPRRVFLCSQSDLFHPARPTEHIDAVLACAALARGTMMVLTKRAEGMRKHMHDLASLSPVARATRFHAAVTDAGVTPRPEWLNRWYALPAKIPNLMLGVSAENQRYADERIPELLQTPAALRFVSLEPLLGPISLGLHLGVPLADGAPSAANARSSRPCVVFSSGTAPDTARASMRVIRCPGRQWQGSLPILDWVIAGAESGPGARPAELDWFRSIRDQCVAAGVPYFLKQADVCETCSGTGRESHVQVCRTCLSLARAGKVRKGCPALDGRVWDQVPEVK